MRLLRDFCQAKGSGVRAQTDGSKLGTGGGCWDPAGQASSHRRSQLVLFCAF